MAFPYSIEIGRAGGAYLNIASAPVGGTTLEVWVKPINVSADYPIGAALHGTNWYAHLGVSVMSSTTLNISLQVWDFPGFAGNHYVYSVNSLNVGAAATDWICVTLQVVVGSPNTTFTGWIRYGASGSTSLLGSQSLANSSFTTGGVDATEISAVSIGYLNSDAACNLNAVAAKVYAESSQPSLATLDARSATMAPDASAWADWPLTWTAGAPVLTDQSGHGRDITGVGTLYQGAVGPLDQSSGSTYTAPVGETVTEDEATGVAEIYSVTLLELAWLAEFAAPVGDAFQDDAFQDDAFQFGGGSLYTEPVAEGVGIADGVGITGGHIVYTVGLGDTGSVVESAAAVLGANEGKADTVSITDAVVANIPAVIPITIGAHSVSMKAGTPVASLSSPSLDTQPTGSTIIVSISRGQISGEVLPTDNKGNTYVKFDAGEYPDYWGSGTSLFAGTNAAGGAGHIVSVGNTAGDEITMFVVEVTGVDTIHDHNVAVYTDSALTGLLSPTVATTGPGGIVVICCPGAGQGPSTYSANNGFSILDEAVPAPSGWIQGASAARTVDAAGSYNTTVSYDLAQNGFIFAVALQSSLVRYAADLIDSGGVSDSVSPTSVATQGIADNHGTADLLVPTVTGAITFDDTLSEIESALASGRGVADVFDSLGIAESIGTGLLIVLTLIDAITKVENISTGGTTTYTTDLSDAHATVEALTYALTMAPAVAETVGLSDDQTARLVAILTVAESVAKFDNLAGGLLAALLVAEAVVSFEDSSISKITAQALADTFNLSDGQAAGIVIAVALADAAAHDDGIGAILSALQPLFEGNSASDSVSIGGTTTYSADLSDSHAPSDSLLARLASIVGHADASNAAEIVGTIASLAPSLVDLHNLNDGQATQFYTFVGLLETGLESVSVASGGTSVYAADLTDGNSMSDGLITSTRLPADVVATDSTDVTVAAYTTLVVQTNDQHNAAEAPVTQVLSAALLSSLTASSEGVLGALSFPASLQEDHTGLDGLGTTMQAVSSLASTTSLQESQTIYRTSAEEVFDGMYSEDALGAGKYDPVPLIDNTDNSDNIATRGSVFVYLGVSSAWSDYVQVAGGRTSGRPSVRNVHIINTKVRSFSLDYNEVMWEIEDTTLDPNDYVFYVLRSESPEGPFDILAGPFSDRYRYIDDRINPLHQQRQIYYRIRSVSKSDFTNVVETESVIQYPDTDLIGAEIQRAERIVWDEYAGRVCFVFPARTFGQRCYDCYDGPAQGKGFTSSKRSTHCITCYDTGFVRGYFDPIQISIQIDPTTDALQNHPLVQQQQAGTRARMPNYPLLKPRDLIVEAENKRWRVVTVTPTERLRSAVHQELTLKELERSEIEYQLPIRMDDLRSFEPSPIRNFTNPQDIDNLTDKAIVDVFGVFPRRT